MRPYLPENNWILQYFYVFYGMTCLGLIAYSFMKMVDAIEGEKKLREKLRDKAKFIVLLNMYVGLFLLIFYFITGWKLSKKAQLYRIGFIASFLAFWAPAAPVILKKIGISQ